MAFDRSPGDEQRLPDLAVGHPLGSEIGDATLTGRERVHPDPRSATGPSPGGPQLGLGPPGQWGGAEPMGHVERVPQQGAALLALVRPPQLGAEVAHRPCPPQLGVATLELLDGLPERVLAPTSAVRDSDRGQGITQGAGGAEAAGQLELLVRQRTRPVPIAEHQVRGRRL